MKNAYIHISIGAVALIALIALGLALYFAMARNVEVATDKSDYSVGGSLIVNIRNDFGRRVCFSSCYPYRMEISRAGAENNRAEWAVYEYDDCPDTDVAAVCLAKNESKRFQIRLNDIDPGMHHLKIGVCSSCDIGEPFNQEKVFYSNNFEVR